MDNPLASDLNHILSKTKDLWEEIRGKRIFITGGTGFFGSWLLESFCWANNILDLRAEVTILTRKPDAFKAKCPHITSDPSVVLCKGDITDFSFPPGKFPFIIHASAVLNESDPAKMTDIIIHGTHRTLEFAREAGTKKFLLTSSGAVYGKQPSEIEQLNENFLGAPDTMNPQWFYGECKRCAEILCATYSKNFQIEMKIARCFAFVGPYLPLDFHFAIGNFIRDSLKGGPINVNGDGTPCRSYMYAADLAVWLWTIFFKGEVIRPYNVGSSRQICIKELANKIAVLSNPASSVIIKTPKNLKNPIDRYVPNTMRAKKELHLSESIPIDDAIRKTIHWYKSLIEKQKNQYRL
jgi:nucleoside-diphosphate-sugar epimerase